MSLNNLGDRLSDLGRREEALAATRRRSAICTRAGRARPDAFLPDLAGVAEQPGQQAERPGPARGGAGGGRGGGGDPSRAGGAAARRLPPGPGHVAEQPGPHAERPGPARGGAGGGEEAVGLSIERWRRRGPTPSCPTWPDPSLCWEIVSRRWAVSIELLLTTAKRSRHCCHTCNGGRTATPI